MESPATPTPPTCPFCRSHEVTTTSTSTDEGVYWRCHTCGQIWNPARLLAFKRRG
jgi:transposase-like protein